MNTELLRKTTHLQEPCLSILISMVAAEQCIFSSQQLSGSDLGHEIRTACLETFNIRQIMVDCKAIRNIDDLHEVILVKSTSAWIDKAPLGEDFKDHRNSSITKQKSSSFKGLEEYEDAGREIANVVIAINLDLAVAEIQVQLIELLRRNRIFTRTAMYTAPKDFLLLATLSKPTARLSYHLNDMIAISCMNYTTSQDVLEKSGHSHLIITKENIASLRAAAVSTRLTAEMDAYLHNIVLFMRMSRYVQAGVTATATRHFRAICKTLAPINGFGFVTPTIVISSARQIYPHRIVLATAETEKSLQWGSDPQAVQEILKNESIISVIDDVIASVETPL